MAAAPAAIVLVSLLLISWSCHAEDTPVILLQVVNAVEKLIGFYKSSYQHLNLDGVYGVRIIEGQIHRLLDEHKQGKHTHLSPHILTRLSAVMKDSQWVYERAISTVRGDDEQYFQDLAFITAQPWTLFKRHRKIIPSLRWEIPLYKANADYQISEKQSDKCMTELRWSNRTTAEGQSGRTCRFTEHCGAIMTKKGLTDYSITHQILWTALAEMMGCEADMNTLLRKLGFKSIDHMHDEFCTNLYYEMLAVVHVYMAGTVKTQHQDLFLEQQFVCPSLGYYEFLKKMYLDQILSWQFPSGCFGDDPEGESVLQDQIPQQRQNNVEVPDKVNGLPSVKTLDQRQQQLSQQLKDLQSSKVAKKLPVPQQDDVNDHVDVVHQQFQKVDTKRSAVARNENPLLFDRERAMKVVNQHKVHQPSREADSVVFELPGSQNKLPVPQNGGFTDQKLQAPSSLERTKESRNQNLGLVDPHVVKRPQVKHPDNQDHLNKLPLKAKGDGVYQGVHSRKEQRLPGIQAAQQESNGVRDAASVIRKKGIFQDLLPQNLKPDMPKKRQLPSGQQPDTSGGAQGRMRKLLMEKEMPGHCQSHKTSVAAGALMMYLKYLIDPGPLDLLSPHDFFPNASRNLLGSNKSNKMIENFLGDQLRNFGGGKGDNVKVEGGGRNQLMKFEAVGFNPQGKERRDANGDDREEEEEDNDDEDDEYDDQEELYPDAREEIGQQREKKVVHFGANDHPRLRDQDEDYLDNKEDEKDEYADENDDNEEEEEGDYIKRVKGDDNRAANPIEKDNIEEDTEYTYYDDDEDDTDRGIIKRHKPQVPPQKGARIRAHNRHKPHPASIDKVPMGLPDSPPTKTVVVLLSATSLLLIVFMYRFIRKRRIHFRHNSRGFFKL